MSILVNTGFKVGGAEPLNEYSVRETLDDRDDLVTNGYVYEGMEVYCKDTKIKYRWNGAAWDVLDNTPVEDDSSDTTVVFDKSMDTGKYFLLAKITDANYTNNIIRFSCPNFKGQNQVGFRYDTDMDILKFELHFNTGSRNEINGYGVTLKQHGLGLYSYPLDNPKNTSPEIKDAVRLYWDSNKSEIYVFLVDLMTAIPHCCLEYTGSGTLLKENTFISDNMYNWNAGSSATWQESKWKSIPYNKLEAPPIFDLGGNGGSADCIKTYTTLSELGLTTNATIQEVIDAVPVGSTAVLRTDEFANWSTLFNGIQYGYFKVEKTVNGLSNIELQEVTVPNRRYFGAQSSGKFSAWQQMGSITLIANTTTLKLDVTKKNSSWYGAIKLIYLYDTSPVEVEISFRSATDDLRWAIINGQKYINKITYTQDSSNNAHYTIGIEFSGTTYGCYQAEVIGDFADINSLTKEAFTGEKTAVYYSPWGKNNGVTLVSAPEDIGLTYPCTTVQLVQAMRDKFNKTINAGAIGVFNCGGKTSTITDAPSDYGLLHIETFGHDRVMIRYDGIAGSNYNGSHVGQIKGNNGTFSGITWTRIDNETRVTTLETQVSELFQSVSNGKTLVANAITGKGVSTSSTATFATMATNISKISSYKEETKSFPVPLTGSTTITSTFSADVIGIKQIILPTDNSRLIPQTTLESFKIEGKNVTMTIAGSGTWKVTALIKA